MNILHSCILNKRKEMNIFIFYKYLQNSSIYVSIQKGMFFKNKKIKIKNKKQF